MPRLVDALLLDLDGLFRHWHDTGAAAGERDAHLPAGTFDRYAYAHPTYRLAQLGVLTDAQWAADVTRRLTADFGHRAGKAIAPWRADRGVIDPIMIDLAGQARRHVPVAVLSNTTDALPTDLLHHGIADTFDQVFASAHLGVDKPCPLAYQIACQRLGVAPARVWFTDDEQPYIDGARHAGLRADLFTGAAQFAHTLTQLGIPVRLPAPVQVRAA